MGIKECLDTACNNARDSASRARASELAAKASENSARDSAEKAINAKNQAITAKDSAERAWENIQDYVIPTEATYSKDEFDSLYELLINQTTENRALISVYHEQTN